MKKRIELHVESDEGQPPVRVALESSANQWMVHHLDSGKKTPLRHGVSESLGRLRFFLPDRNPSAETKPVLMLLAALIALLTLKLWWLTPHSWARIGLHVFSYFLVFGTQLWVLRWALRRWSPNHETLALPTLVIGCLIETALQIAMSFATIEILGLATLARITTVLVVLISRGALPLRAPRVIVVSLAVLFLLAEESPDLPLAGLQAHEGRLTFETVETFVTEIAPQ